MSSQELPSPRHVAEPKSAAQADGAIPSLANLLRVAKEGYANTDKSCWLAAGLITGDGLRVQRCKECDPAAGTIRVGIMWLPFGCVRALDSITLGERGRYKLLALSLRDNAEMDRFAEFARQAGADLVAAPPAWIKITASDPVTTWAALLFLAPFTEGYVSQHDGGGLLITSPWAASLAAIRAWENPIQDAEGSAPRKRGCPRQPGWEADAELAEAWARAKRAGVQRKQFATDRRIDPRKLYNTLNRHAIRTKRHKAAD